MSTPTGSAPRAAAAAAKCPRPVATSSTRMPAPTPAASNRGSTKRAVIAPVTRADVLARRDHPAASNALNFSAASAITLTLSRQRQGRGTSSAWAASRAECSTRPCNTPRTRRCRAGGALSDAERRAVYRLRHDQVIGGGWAECYADGLEHDTYDIDALHICEWRGPDLVGTVRVVL